MIEFGRKAELKRLFAFKGNGKIKVVTGLRRVGKSYLLSPLFKRELLSCGYSEEQIAELNLLGKDYGISTPTQLAEAIKKEIGRSTKFLIIDEAQLAGPGFAKVLLSFRSVRPDVDCYITGSNSDILSKDIVQQFKGMAKEIKVTPLTLSEIRESIPDYPLSKYLRFGGIPLVLNCVSDESKEEELRDLWANTYLSDIHDRFEGQLISERLQKEIIVFILTNITSPTSEKSIAKKILGRLHPSNEEIAQLHAEIGDLVQAARDAFLLIGFEQKGLVDSYEGTTQCPVGRMLKNYCADLGLLQIISESLSKDGDALENAVFLRILSKGFLPHGETVRKDDGRKGEVDFVYKDSQHTHFIQVAYMLNETNRYRELDFLAEQTPNRGSKTEVVCFDCRLDSIPDGIEIYQGEAFFTNR